MFHSRYLCVTAREQLSITSSSRLKPMSQKRLRGQYLRSTVLPQSDMSLASKIEWTDATWNPVRGCTKISPGCKHCYASTFAERFRGVKGHPYEQGFELRLVSEKLAEPLRWAAPKT